MQLMFVVYNFPNDEKEQDRLDMIHHLCLLLLDDELHLTDLPKNQVIRILDVGTGTGIWSMDMGDKYPNAQIIGNELSAIQPKWYARDVQCECETDRCKGAAERRV
jgi:tRNA G46 methylase TrmB